MKVLMAIPFLCVLAGSGWCADKPVLLSAYATSRSADSSDPICLIDPSCTGHWSPGSKDNGVNEGVYYQFERPVKVSFIQVRLKEAVSRSDLPPVRFYIDGKTTSPEKYIYEADQLDPHTFRIGVRVGLAVRPMTSPMRSFYLCGDKGYGSSGERATVERIAFLAGEKTSQPLAIQLPAVLPAIVTASSVLKPEPAYQPGHLFDSRADLAWATDGSQTTGVNESFTVEFQERQSIAGLMVWNGYERSPAHFQANARVRTAEIRTEDGAPESIELKDLDGPQRILLRHARMTRKFIFTIKGVIPGSKYRDVLLSELRFVLPSGQLLLPRVRLQETLPPAAWEPLLERSWTSILTGTETAGGCKDLLYSDRMRIRSDGTFIIFIGTSMDSRDNRITSHVLEGNWEPKGDQIRIFGKRYATDLVTSEYLVEEHQAAPEIFQSLLTVKPYRSMTPEEKREILATSRAPASIGYRIDISTDSRLNRIDAKDLDSFMALADTIFTRVNPYFVHSPVFSALVLPTDEVSSSSGGCE